MITEHVVSVTRSVAFSIQQEMRANDKHKMVDIHAPYLKKFFKNLQKSHYDLDAIFLIDKRKGHIEFINNENDEIYIQRLLPAENNLLKAIDRARHSNQPLFSEWKFLKYHVFFFFTPEPAEIEYTCMSVPEIETAPSEENPVVVCVFNASSLREKLAMIDINSGTIITASIVLASAFSLLLRRRSIQREEAVEQKLDTLFLLSKRDAILAAAVKAADKFMSTEDLEEPMVHFLEKVSEMIEARAGYFTPFTPHESLNEPSHCFGQLPTTQPFDARLLNQPRWHTWKQHLDKNHWVGGSLEAVPEEERGWMKKEKIEAFTIVPVLAETQWVGLLVFEHSEGPVFWEPGLMDTLKLTANLFGAAMGRRENEKRLTQSNKMGALGRMASSMAHEFNNLLHMITGHLHLLKQKVAQHTELLHTINIASQAAERGSKIIDQILRATHQSEMDLHSGSLNEIISRTIELAQAGLPKTLQIELDIDRSIPLVALDESQLQQVILNILLNAHDACGPQGRITIRTGIRHRWIADERDYKPFAFCSIEDNGPGIPDDVIESIFDPFFTTKAPGHGTGLGLSICMGILSKHNGMIEATNRSQGGALFTFYLPIVKNLPTPTHTASHGTSEWKARGIVCIADDEPFCLDLLNDLLKEAGFDVFQAANGDALLKQIEAHQPAWIITDWTMPGLSGAELIQVLHKKAPQAQLLLTSGFLLNENLPPYVKGVLKKPFRPDELFKAMQQTAVQV